MFSANSQSHRVGLFDDPVQRLYDCILVLNHDFVRWFAHRASMGTNLGNVTIGCGREELGGAKQNRIVNATFLIANRPKSLFGLTLRGVCLAAAPRVFIWPLSLFTGSMER